MITRHTQQKQVSSQCLWGIGYFVLLAIWFVAMLHLRPLNNPDESRYASIAWSMLKSTQFIIPKVDQLIFLDKPPLLYWLTALSIKLMGLHIWSLRLVPALSAWLGVVLTWCFCRTLFNRRVAFISSFILATSPLYWLMANYLNMDMLIAVLIMASLYSFYWGLQISKRRNVWIYSAYILASCAFLAKGLISMVIPALIIFIWLCLSGHIRHKQTWRKLHIIPGLLVYVLLCLPWCLLAQHQLNNFFHYFFVYEQFSRYVASGFNNQLPIWFYVPVLFLGCWPWTSLLGSAGFYLTRPSPWRAHYCFLLSWFCGVLIFFSIPSSKIVSYILPAIFPLVILLACYIDSIWQHRSREHKLLLTVPLSFLGIAIALVYAGFHPNLLGLSTGHGQLWLITYAVGLGILSFGLLLSFFYATVKQYVLAMACLMSVSLIMAVSLVPSIMKDSNYQLCLRLKSTLAKYQYVVMYNSFEHDVPLYLNRPVYLVNHWSAIKTTDDNWQGHFKYAQQFNHQQHMLWREQDFMTKWRQPKTSMLVFINKQQLPSISASLKPYKLIDYNQQYVVISAARFNPVNTQRH